MSGFASNQRSASSTETNSECKTLAYIAIILTILKSENCYIFAL